jgi:hypothetical protein
MTFEGLCEAFLKAFKRPAPAYNHVGPLRTAFAAFKMTFKGLSKGDTLLAPRHLAGTMPAPEHPADILRTPEHRHPANT